MKIIIPDNDQLLVVSCFQLSGSKCVKIVEMNIFDQFRQAAADASLRKMWRSLLMKMIPDNIFLLLGPFCSLSGAICARIAEMNILA